LPRAALVRFCLLARSHCSPEPPKIPPPKIDEESEPTAFTHSEKTDIFRKWFLPEAEAALDDIQERTFDDDTFGQTIEIDSQITPEQGEAVEGDSIPMMMGFLKACGEPLYRLLGEYDDSEARVLSSPVSGRELTSRRLAAKSTP
jgi:hypothetical protein